MYIPGVFHEPYKDTSSDMVRTEYRREHESDDGGVGVGSSLSFVIIVAESRRLFNEPVLGTRSGGRDSTI